MNVTPPYKEKMEYTIIDVINKGRRPVIIGNVGAYLKNGKGIILSDSLRAGYQKINEGEAKTYSIEQKLIDFKEIICFTASSQAGKTYFKRVSSLKDYLYLRLNRLFLQKTKQKGKRRKGKRNSNSIKSKKF